MWHQHPLVTIPRRRQRDSAENSWTFSTIILTLCTECLIRIYVSRVQNIHSQIIIIFLFPWFMLGVHWQHCNIMYFLSPFFYQKPKYLMAWPVSNLLVLGWAWGWGGVSIHVYGTRCFNHLATGHGWRGLLGDYKYYGTIITGELLPLVFRFSPVIVYHKCTYILCRSSIEFLNVPGFLRSSRNEISYDMTKPIALRGHSECIYAYWWSEWAEPLATATRWSWHIAGSFFKLNIVWDWIPWRPCNGSCIMHEAVCACTEIRRWDGCLPTSN